MLGTPSVRISSFSGKLRVLDELEYNYKLTYSFLPDKKDEVLSLINDLLKIPDLKDDFRIRMRKMLEEKIDVSAFMIWFITEFPASFDKMKVEPNYQLNFR